jgi:uncharacterized alkaline shock family protein YloU
MSTTVDTTDQDQTGSALRTSRGTTTIADGVVAKIASLAAREVRGVAALGGGAASALGSMVGRLRGQEHSTPGVGVEVGQSEAAVDLAVRVLYPEPIKQVADELRDRVIDRIRSLTGLDVVEVNVQVVDLVFPGDASDDDGSGQQGRVQ